MPGIENPTGLFLVGAAVFWIAALVKMGREHPQDRRAVLIGILVWAGLALWGVWIAINPPPDYAPGETKTWGEIVGLDRLAR